MDIALIGAGNVAKALARNFLSHGHEVRFGVRDPNDTKYDATKKELPQASFELIADATKEAEIVLLTTPWAAVKDGLSQIGKAQVVLVDCTNPIDPESGNLAHVEEKSGAEQIQEMLPEALVFKTFNQTGFENMKDPRFASGKPIMFIAGPEGEAKKAILKLASSTGFESCDAGPLKNARYLENLAMLWIQLAVGQKMGRNFAFGLLRR